MPRLIQWCAMCFAALSLTGCLIGPANRVVFVDSREDVTRLGDDVTGHVYFQQADGTWVRSKNKVKLPAGWYAGYIPSTNFTVKPNGK